MFFYNTIRLLSIANGEGAVFEQRGGIIGLLSNMIVQKPHFLRKVLMASVDRIAPLANTIGLDMGSHQSDEARLLSDCPPGEGALAGILENGGLGSILGEHGILGKDGIGAILGEHGILGNDGIGAILGEHGILGNDGIGAILGEHGILGKDGLGSILGEHGIAGIGEDILTSLSNMLGENGFLSMADLRESLGRDGMLNLGSLLDNEGILGIDSMINGNLIQDNVITTILSLPARVIEMILSILMLNDTKLLGDVLNGSLLGRLQNGTEQDVQKVIEEAIEFATKGSPMLEQEVHAFSKTTSDELHNGSAVVLATKNESEGTTSISVQGIEAAEVGDFIILDVILEDYTEGVAQYALTSDDIANGFAEYMISGNILSVNAEIGGETIDTTLVQ